MSAEDVARAVGVDVAHGLDLAEAGRRAETAGPNALRPNRREPAWRMVVEAATEPFVLLLFGSGILAAALGEVRDGLLILVALLPIVGADVVTEYRGERALEALRDATAPRAWARRGGAVVDVPADSLVPGDVVLLGPGDVVPADLRCVTTERLLLDRSVLTGESVPELAATAPDRLDASLAQRQSMLYSGTSVVGGRGEGIVVAIGAGTEVGRIAGGIGSRERRRSPLQLELDRLVRLLLVVAVGLIAIVSGLGFARGQELGANLLAGISAAIAAIPEEPPILLAVILGLGAYRLLRKNVLVRRLNAEETLGAVDLIVTDKTGTLTQNRLEVSSVRTLDGPVADPTARITVLGDALRAEEDAWPRPGVMPGSFTRAITDALAGSGAPVALDASDLIDAEGASDVTRYSRTRSRFAGGIRELALGAPESIVELAAATQGAERAAAWRAITATAAAAGERLLALGQRDGDRWHVEALIGFADPPRPGIADALAVARRAGIQTIVVTGDHPETAAAIARASGLDATHVVTGADLEGWDDARVTRELPELHVVARSTPEGKERLVRLARRAGHMVAVTGDGVNDAPALHQADVGVSMGSGTAVAREASDLVLGDDSFATLVFGIGEGRRIVDNIQKGLIFLLSTHVALLGFLLIATLAGYGQPLLPIQILWLELFIDLSTSVAFEREPAEPDLMVRPPRPRGRPLLDGGLLLRLSVAGGFSAVAALAVMLAHDHFSGSPPGLDESRWLAFTVLVVGQAVRAYANRSIREPIHRLARNGLLLASVVLVIGVQAAIPLVPPIAQAFRATPLNAMEWLLVVIIALGPAILAEAIRTIRHGLWVA